MDKYFPNSFCIKKAIKINFKLTYKLISKMEIISFQTHIDFRLNGQKAAKNLYKTEMFSQNDQIHNIVEVESDQPKKKYMI